MNSVNYYLILLLVIFKSLDTLYYKACYFTGSGEYDIVISARPETIKQINRD